MAGRPVPTCESCQFLNRWRWPGDTLYMLECRRFPPSIATKSQRYHMRPAVDLDDWCGEYKLQMTEAMMDEAVAEIKAIYPLPSETEKP